MALTDSLIYYWPMNGVVGSNIRAKFDTQVFRPLVAINDVTFATGGKIQNKLSFPTSSITVGPHPSESTGIILSSGSYNGNHNEVFLTKTTNTFTCSFWFRLEASLTKRQGLIGCYNIWSCVYNPSGPKIDFIVRNTANTANTTVSATFSSGPALDTWYMCAIRWNGSGQQLQVSLYDASETLINTSNTVTGYGTSSSSGFNDVTLGNSYDSILSNLNFGGSICNLAFWSRVLSNSELDDLYNDNNAVLINTITTYPLLTNAKSHWPISNTGNSDKPDEIDTNDLTNVGVEDDFFSGSSVSGSPTPGSSTLFAGTCANDASIGTNAWSSPTNAQGDTGLAADGLTNTQYLKCTNYGFNIPTNATVTGIVADVQVLDLDPNVFDNAVRIVKGGVIGSTDKASLTEWPTSPLTYITHGSSSDLWGETWTYSDINSSGFGVAISAKSTPTGNRCSIYRVRITVHYTTPGSAIADAAYVYLDNASDTDIQLSPGNEDWGFSCWFDLSSLPNDSSRVIAGKWMTKDFWYKNSNYYSSSDTFKDNEWVLWINKDAIFEPFLNFTIAGYEGGDLTKGRILTIPITSLDNLMDENFVSVTGYKENITSLNPDHQAYHIVVRLNGDLVYSDFTVLGEANSNTTVNFINPNGDADFRIGGVDSTPFTTIGTTAVSVNNFHGIINKATFWKRKLTDDDHITLYYYGGSFPLSDTDGVTLFLHGYSDDNANITLVTDGTRTPYNTLTLYLPGQSVQDYTTLFIHGNTELTGTLNLHTHGYLTDNGGIPLYICADTSLTFGGPPYVFPLFLKGIDPTEINDSLNLFLWSTTNNGILSQIPLFVKVGETSSAYNNNMNLFLQVDSLGTLNSNLLPLFLQVDANANASLPLFVFNDGPSSTLTLYLKGKGYKAVEPKVGSDGWFPDYNSMNLFINRPDESIMIPLFVKAMDDVANSSVNIYTFGAYLSNSNVNLVIPNVYDDLDNSLKLYLFGF